MKPEITIQKNVPVFNLSEIGKWTEFELKERTLLRRPLMPAGYDHAPMFFLENSAGIHLFTGHYPSKRIAAQVAKEAKKCFRKPIHLYPVGLPKLNIEKLPDEGPITSAACDSQEPEQLGFPLTW